VKFLAEVKVFDDQVEKALKILKRKLAQNGTFKEIKKRRFYEKPSVKKKRKRQEAAKRRAKASRKTRDSRFRD
jgi:small subunit ribosomal protein S21